MIAALTSAGLACGTRPKRIVATPATIGEAKLVAQPPWSVPEVPFTGAMIPWVGVAMSTIVFP